MILDVKDLAAKTAAEIRRRNWIQGDLADVAPEGWEWHEFVDQCGVCLIGGIAAAYLNERAA